MNLQYGTSYYDQYVLANWDYAQPASEDQTQWNTIARKWVALTLQEREPWYELGPDMGGKPRIFSPEQINRVLVPHQTLQERNFGHDPHVGTRATWLRTCYAPELDKSYEDMLGETCDTVVYPEHTLDDADLYYLEEKWDRVLNRIPTLCDVYFNEGQHEWFLSDDPPPPSDPTFGLWDAALREVAMVYLIDRQALLEKLITVMWLDCHGECVWWYRIKADYDQLMSFTGRLARTGGLMAFLEFADPGMVGQGVLEKGGLINWIG